jgi:hypothetical protein
MHNLSQETAMPFAPDEPATLADPKALLHVPVGLVSPLWPLFAGAAVTGATWWWMTRWTQPANLEAMFGGAIRTALQVPVEPVAEALIEAEPVVGAASETLEANAEAAIEPVLEVAPETVLEALVEAPAEPELVVGESAPISPALDAAAPEPKVRKKPTAPKVG